LICVNFGLPRLVIFTPWLAQEDNIYLLGDAIGIELEVEAQEKNVGPFRADILCKDIVTEQWVLFQSQMNGHPGRSGHGEKPDYACWLRTGTESGPAASGGRDRQAGA
jgi:hypothetical protein